MVNGSSSTRKESLMMINKIETCRMFFNKKSFKLFKCDLKRVHELV